jgi:light-regulated signal transduction histidine kinase (bacteriophytochrome)
MIEQELEDIDYLATHDMAAQVRHVAEFSRLLVKDFGEALTPRQQRFATRIAEANDRCQAMMEQLRVYARLQKAPLERRRCDAGQLMRTAMLQLGDEIRAAEAEVVIGPLGEVDADPELLLNALRRLIDNAVKFGRPDVAPHIEAARHPLPGAWVLRLSDNGRGIEPEYQEKAFRMFQRLHPEDGQAGVGAGLTLCRRIARRHGGEARFVDQPTGACIELSIPYTEDHQ